MGGLIMEFAPYTDTTLYPLFDINKVPGVSAFCLGFIVADASGRPAWGGYYRVDRGYYGSVIHQAQSKGTKLIASFGGAAGKELALVSKNSTELFMKYKNVIDEYKFSSIDFDIEGEAVKDRKANKSRQEAILELQRRYPNLEISITVPVMPTGLDKDYLDLVSMTPCDIVNLMCMDYGSVKDMGKAAIEAALSARKQTGKKIGITVMIGKNDTGEIFTLEDASMVHKFAKENKWVKRTSFWSINRDLGKDGNIEVSSQIKQPEYGFSQIFNKQ
jgi:hypothetical protein